MEEQKGQGERRPDIEQVETGQGAPISEGQGNLFGFTHRDAEEMTNPEPIVSGASWNEGTDTSTRTFSAILKEWTPDKEADLYSAAGWSEACKWLTEEAQRQRPDNLAEWRYPAPRYEVSLSQECTAIPPISKKSSNSGYPVCSGPVTVGVRYIPDYTPPITAEEAEDFRLLVAAWESSLKQEEEAKEALPPLQSILPDNAVMPNSKVANNLPLLCGRAGKGTELIVGKRTSKTPATVVATLAYDNKNLHTSKDLTAYDREVLNGVCSLFAAGNREFTPAMVYRAMNGQTGGAKVHVESLKKVSKSIDKLRWTRLTIDYTEQAREWKIPGKVKDCKADDSLLSVTGVWMKRSNGDEIEAYRFNTAPLLYSYSKKIKQVITVPIKLLDTRSKLNTTEDVTNIRGYLIRRIEGMRGKSGINSSQIRYSTIMEEAGIDSDDYARARKKKAAVMDQVDSLLQHFKEQGFIKGAERYKKGRAYEGVNINL